MNKTVVSVISKIKTLQKDKNHYLIVNDKKNEKKLKLREEIREVFH